jgi:hypothetical protein
MYCAESVSEFLRNATARSNPLYCGESVYFWVLISKVLSMFATADNMA